MSRRFSDEPIHIIRRIPSPEQLSAARPVKRPLGQAVLEAAAGCIRSIADGLANVMRIGAGAPGPSAEAAPENAPGSPRQDAELPHGGGGSTAESRSIPASAATGASSEAAVSVQPDEIAELRAFLLAQQQDIARLSAQIHELKALVVSQQQVLVYLGQELESSPLVSATGVASGPGKRNRPARDRSAKEKPVPRKDSSASSSLTL
jgi:hypothetical protein